VYMAVGCSGSRVATTASRRRQRAAACRARAR
jgi:hypothetical protein